MSIVIMTIKLLKKSKFAELKPNEYSHYDNQTLKAGVSHMIKFTGLKSNEYSHHDNQTLKTRASHLTKFTMLRTNEYSH